MAQAIDGAERRWAEFNSTRALQLADNELTDVDAQIGKLGARIAQMRQLTQGLAAEI